MSERERARRRNDAVHTTWDVVATLWTRRALTNETNSDVRTPWVQTRGGTGKLLPTDAALIQSETRLKLDF